MECGCGLSPQAAFPPHFRHPLAVKRAPMSFVLEEALAGGLGAACASFGAAAHALACGCDPSWVGFDSPAKSVEELRWALEVGVAVNADSLEELRRIDALVAIAFPSECIVAASMEHWQRLSSPSFLAPRMRRASSGAARSPSS